MSALDDVTTADLDLSTKVVTIDTEPRSDKPPASARSDTSGTL
jgi:hypothetical protein